MLYLIIITLVVAGAGLCYYMTRPKKSIDITPLFPATVMITREMIATAVLKDTSACIGALALKSFLPEKCQVVWGVDTGSILCKNSVTRLSTGIDVMHITEPQEVTFKITSHYEF